MTKPIRRNETVEIIRAWANDRLKALLQEKHITYHCAMMRISRFRRKHAREFKKILGC